MVVATEGADDQKTRILGEKLYSDRSFRNTEINGVSGSTTSTSYVDVSGSDIEIIVEKPATIMVLVSAFLYTSGSSIYTSTIAVDQDGVELDPLVQSAGEGRAEVVTSHYVINLDVGTYNFKLKLKSENVLGTAVLQSGRMSILYLTE